MINAPTQEAIKSYWENSTPFRDFKETYEDRRTFRYQLQDYMHDSFHFEKWNGKKVVEIGCGVGIDSIEFARNGAIVTSCDITQDALSRTMEHAMQAGVRLRIEQASATQLPFAANTFDLGFSFGVLHHIPDIKTALQEIRRVLVHGGKFMGMFYNRDSLLHAYSIVGEHSDEGLSEHELECKYSERNLGCPYTHCYRKSELVALFSMVGFNDITVDVRFNVIDLPRQRKVKLQIDDKYELGWHLIVKATK